MTRRSGWLAAACVAIAAMPATATTYQTPQDYGVACLELATGKELWRTPGRLKPPEIRVVGGLVVAREDPAYKAHGGKAAPALVLDAATGKVVKRAAPGGGTGPLATLARSYAHRGRTVAHGESSTGGISYEADGKHGIEDFLTFDWGANELFVLGNLVVFTFDIEPGGEVFAYDLDRRKLAWEFRAYDHVKTIPERDYTSIAPDGDRVLVSIDQHVFALDAATGKVMWQTALPRQNIRTYDRAWATFGKHRDVLLVRVYEDLFALQASDGKLLWQFDGGMLGRVWPTVVGDKVYVARRGEKVNITSTTLGGGSSRGRPSAIHVARDGKGWKLVAASNRDAPPNLTRWSIFRPPPARPKTHKGPTIVLAVDGGHDTTYDLSTVLKTEAWIHLKGIFTRARLEIDGREVAAIEIPPSL